MIEGILWVLFILGCLLACAVILLQDPKGGGLGEAFGGAGQQAFGVDNKGIAKFTTYVAVVVVLIAVAITKIRSDDSVIVEFAEPPLTPAGTAVDPAPVDGQDPTTPIQDTTPPPAPADAGGEDEGDN